MMKTRKVIALSLLTVLALTLGTQKAIAVEPLSAKELATHCLAYPATPESLDAQFCIRYIQGFIDGAIATDAQVMLNVEADLKRKETFMERVIRTRSPSRSKQDRAAQYAEFCLGAPVQLRDIVNKVVTNLLKREEVQEGILARAVVYGVLRKHYPCKQTISK